MRRLIAASVFLCLVAGLPQTRAEKPKDDVTELVRAKTRLEYSHISLRGNLCRFELGPKGGDADFYWDGERRQRKLEFVKQVKDKVKEKDKDKEKEREIAYNVYKVAGRDFWFFFPAEGVTKKGEKDYPMRYSMRGPDMAGSVAIETRGPTKVRKFEIKD